MEVKKVRARCKYVKCFAGMGVAGNGCCFLGGDPQNPNCEKFKDEDKELQEQEKRRAMSRWHR